MLNNTKLSRVFTTAALALVVILLAACGNTRSESNPLDSASGLDSPPAAPESTPDIELDDTVETSEPVVVRAVNIDETAKQYYARSLDSFLFQSRQKSYRDVMLKDIDGDGFEELLGYWEEKIPNPDGYDGSDELIFELYVFDYQHYPMLNYFTEEKTEYYGYDHENTFFFTDKGYLAYYTHGADISQLPGWVYSFSEQHPINGGIYSPDWTESAAYELDDISQDEFERICGELGLVTRRVESGDGMVIVSYEPGESIFPYADTERDIETIRSWGYGDIRTDTPWRDIIAVAAGGTHTIGLKKDGTCVAVGANGYGQSMVSDWTDVVAVAAGMNHSIGIKSDGTCVAVGKNDDGQCDLTEWTDIVKVTATERATVGLKADGTCVIAGVDAWRKEINVDNLSDVVDIACGSAYVVGLKSDGTVAASGNITYETGVHGRSEKAIVDVSGATQWRDIIQIIANDDHVIGLKSDGTVVATNTPIEDYGQCDVSALRDVNAIEAAWAYTVALMQDGTVECVGLNEGLDVTVWRDIVGISVGNGYVVGLKKDGTIVAVGANRYGQIDMASQT